MNKEIFTKHTALEFQDKNKADIFFNEILKLQKIKEFDLNKDLSQKIFDINKDVKAVVYGDEDCCFEIFITDKQKNKSFEHTCLEIKDKEGFYNRLKKHNLKPFFVMKNDKKLIFVKDFSDNLYEIK